MVRRDGYRRNPPRCKLIVCSSTSGHGPLTAHLRPSKRLYGDDTESRADIARAASVIGHPNGSTGTREDRQRVPALLEDAPKPYVRLTDPKARRSPCGTQVLDRGRRRRPPGHLFRDQMPMSRVRRRPTRSSHCAHSAADDASRTASGSPARRTPAPRSASWRGPTVAMFFGSCTVCGTEWTVRMQTMWTSVPRDRPNLDQFIGEE